MFRTETTYFIQCDKCNKTYRISGETLKKYVANTLTKAGDIIKSPFRGNLNKLACYDDWQILEPDGHLCPDCRKDKNMNKYITILCYKGKYGMPEFVKTEVFCAEDYDRACSEGSSLLEKKYPEEIKSGYNDWTISVDDLIKEAENLNGVFK